MKHIIFKAIAIGFGIGFVKGILDETVFKKQRERKAAEEARFEKETNEFTENLVKDAFPVPDFLADIDIDNMFGDVFEDLGL